MICHDSKGSSPPNKKKLLNHLYKKLGLVSETKSFSNDLKITKVIKTIFLSIATPEQKCVFRGGQKLDKRKRYFMI